VSRVVFTGWRSVTPGECFVCGFDDGWDCDGRGTITCDCQVELEPPHDCSSIGGWHAADCTLALWRNDAAPRDGDYA
jgi:hypothetical protein